MGYSNVTGDLNVYSVTTTKDLSVRGNSTMVGNLSVLGVSNFQNLIASNLTVTNAFIITATNTQVSNSLSINNSGTSTALFVNQNESTSHIHNVAEFYDHLTVAMIIDPNGNVAIHQARSDGYALSVSQGVLVDNITATGNFTGSAFGLTNVPVTGLYGALSSIQIQNTQSNITSLGTLVTLNTSGISNLNGSIIGTLATPVQSNITTVGLLSNLAVSNSISVSNIVATGNLSVQLLTNLFSANIVTENVQTLNSVFSNILNLNVSTGANITQLTVTTLANISTGNIVTANHQSLNSVFSNILNLNVSTGANITQLTVTTQANISSSNIVTANIQTANIFTMNLINLNVTGTANLLYANIANIYTQNIVGFIGSQWTGTIGTPIYYAQGSVGIGSSGVPTANLTVTGNASISNLLTTSNLSVALTANATTINAASLIATNAMYGPISGSNTINASTIIGGTIYGTFIGPTTGSNNMTVSTLTASTAIYGPISGANTISSTVVTASTNVNSPYVIGTTSLFGTLAGANVVSSSVVYAPISGSNTINCTTLTATTNVNSPYIVSTNSIYGTISGSNVVSSSVVYAPISGANTINCTTLTASTNVNSPYVIGATSLYGTLTGANVVSSSVVYAPISGSNTINCTTLTATTNVNSPYVVSTNSIYGTISGSNAISGTTITGTLISGTVLTGSTNVYSPYIIGTTSLYGTLTGTNVVSASTLYGAHLGSNAVVASAFYGPISGSNTVAASSLTLGTALAVSSGGTGLTSTSNNFVFAGPTSGSGAPSFRALVSGDIPNNAANTSGSAASATNATYAGTAGYCSGNTAGSAASATNAGSATYATTAGYCSGNTAGSAASATNATTAVNQSGGTVSATTGSFSSDITTTGSLNFTGNSTRIKFNYTSTWSGDAGTGFGKLEYHMNRWYINAGSDSVMVCQFRRGGSDVAYVDNSGTYIGNISGSAGSATNATYAGTAGYCSGNTAGSAANAGYANSAGSATNATYAGTAGYCSGNTAGSAANAGYAGYAGTAGALTTNGNANEIYNSGWYRVNGDTGFYHQNRGHGIIINGDSYGNIQTYGAGQNAWNGLSCASNMIFMQNNGTNNGGIYSQATGWWAVYFDGTSAELRSQNNTRVVARTWGAEIYGQLNQNGSIICTGTEIAMGYYNSTSASKYVGVSGTNYCLGGMEIESTTLGGNYSQKVHFRSHHYGVSNGRRVTINEDGLVGIGNESPGYNLDVRGNYRLFNDGYGSGGGSTQLLVAAYGYNQPWNGLVYMTSYFSAGSNGGGGDIRFRNGYDNNSQGYIYSNPIFLGGTQDTQVYIGGNQTGAILKMNDDLWFYDPQDGTIQIRNGGNNPWGTLVGYFTNYSRRDLKKDITLFDQTKLESLYQDTKNTPIYSWKYKTEPDYYPLKYGPILDEAPQYFAATVDENSILVNQYVAMLHGALKVAMQKIESLETRVSDLEKNQTQ